jgi:DNA helicase-2/ATP-dependent DNA helicase PcrA
MRRIIVPRVVGSKRIPPQRSSAPTLVGANGVGPCHLDPGESICPHSSAPLLSVSIFELRFSNLAFPLFRYNGEEMGKLLEMPRRPEPPPHLNEQQWAAVRHLEGPLLVVAGAGTGKTRVITERIGHLLAENAQLDGENVLGLTFTQKAAGEMKQRVLRAVGERGRDVWLGTFHDFCFNRILCEVNPGLQVVDDPDHWILLRRNLAQLGLKEFRRVAEPGQFLADFREFFGRCQDELVSPDDFDAYVRSLEQKLDAERIWLDDEQQKVRAAELARLREVAHAYHVSERLVRERNLCTFGMQLLDAVRLLVANDALRQRLQRDYRFILVDEFQDTNIAQIELLWLLASDHRNILAVGDNDQAIYRFRGASFSSFTLFLERFAGIRPSPSDLGRHFLPLTQNYRSTQRILRVAGHVIAQNEKSSYLPDKRLYTENPPGDKIQLAEFNTPEEEAFWVAGDIAALAAKGHAWREFAVLYRMHSHRELLVEELMRRQIPFVIRNLSILSNMLVRDLLAYLRVIARPWDNVAAARVLAMPAWGLEPSDLVRLCERTSSSKGIRLWDALEDAQGELPFSGKNRNTGELVAMVHELRARACTASALEVLDALAERLGLVLAPAEMGSRYLDALAHFVREWEKKHLTSTRKLPEFLDYLDMFEEAGGVIELPEEHADDAVQLMTVHTAKGLEFDHVYVLRLNDGSFPPRPRPHVLEFPEALMKEERPKGDFRIQEERRLFYVAMTRAKRRLTLTTIIGRRWKPSPFLVDFLSEPALGRSDVRQFAPAVKLPSPEERRLLPAEPDRQQRLFEPAATQPRIFSRIGAWARTYRPPTSAPLQLSASAIDIYESCALQYLFERAWHIRGGPRAAMTFGNVMHTTIRYVVAELGRNPRLAWDDVAAIYQREWKDAGFEDSYQEQEYKKEGLEQLRTFFARYKEDPPKVLELERNFELPLEPDVVIRGRMDQINRLGDSEVEIVDYKTGKPRDERAIKKSLQLSLYALAAREVLELEPARLTFYNLTTNEAVSTARSDKDLQTARDTVAQVADNIRAGNFPSNPGFRCRSCDLRPVCPEHEQLIMIRT